MRIEGQAYWPLDHHHHHERPKVVAYSFSDFLYLMGKNLWKSLIDGIKTMGINKFLQIGIPGLFFLYFVFSIHIVKYINVDQK